MPPRCHPGPIQEHRDTQMTPKCKPLRIQNFNRRIELPPHRQRVKVSVCVCVCVVLCVVCVVCVCVCVCVVCYVCVLCCVVCWVCWNKIKLIRCLQWSDWKSEISNKEKMSKKNPKEKMKRGKGGKSNNASGFTQKSVEGDYAGMRKCPHERDERYERDMRMVKVRKTKTPRLIWLVKMKIHEQNLSNRVSECLQQVTSANSRKK